MALEDRRRIEIVMDTPTFGRVSVTEQERRELMEEMEAGERNPDPSRVVISGSNTDYRMDNGLVIRLHEAPSTMWLELRSPPISATDPGVTLATVARIQDGGSAPATARQRRRDVFARAQRLQPSTPKALAAIDRTVEMEARASRAAGSASSSSVPPTAKAKGRSRSRT